MKVILKIVPVSYRTDSDHSEQTSGLTASMSAPNDRLNWSPQATDLELGRGPGQAGKRASLRLWSSEPAPVWEGKAWSRAPAPGADVPRRHSYQGEEGDLRGGQDPLTLLGSWVGLGLGAGLEPHQTE